MDLYQYIIYQNIDDGKTVWAKGTQWKKGKKRKENGIFRVVEKKVEREAALWG